ncbi:MAG: TolB family protein [Chitinophagales bacterium]
MKKTLTIVFTLLSLYSFGQTGSEILLFDMKISNGQVTLSNGVNITNHKGYDNQPFFYPSQPIIYYASFDDSGRSDIKYYNYEKKETSNLTLTHEREYSPTVTPDGKFISCIIQRDNGVQDLGKYPINGGKPELLINTLKVGYHAWIDKDKLLLFVLVDSNTNNLHLYNLSAKSDTILAVNPGRSLHKIPRQNAMSFIQKNAGKDWMIQKLDLNTMTVSAIAHTLPGQENLTWLQNNIILMSDGKKLFSYHVGTDKEWQPVIITSDDSILKGVTRLATNAANTKLAVVVSE